MSRWQRLKAWFWRQWWLGGLLCILVGAFNIGLAANTDAVANPINLWVSLLSAGWVIGWGMAMAMYHYRLKIQVFTKQQIIEEAEADIQQHADAWARESIRRVMANAKQHGLLPPNVNFFFADEVPPSSDTRH